MRGSGLIEFFGWGNEEAYESAAQGRNRPPPVADEIEVTGHGKPLDFQASEHSCFQLRVHGPGGEYRHASDGLDPLIDSGGSPQMRDHKK